MTLQEFLEKWNGQYCEVAGSVNATNQCVDLANAYLRDVLNQPIVEWTNAIDFPSKLTEKFDYILNTPTGVPREGDMIISGVSYGHIGIFLSGDENRFISFDENYPTGSFCTPVDHNYNSPRVHGWLRMKESVNTIEILSSVIEDLKRKSTVADEVANKLQKPVEKDVLLAEIDLLLKHEDIIIEKQRVIELKDRDIEEMRKQAQTLGEQVNKLSTSISEAQEANQAYVDKLNTQEYEVKKLLFQIKELENIKSVAELSWQSHFGYAFSKLWRWMKDGE